MRHFTLLLVLMLILTGCGVQVVPEGVTSFSPEVYETITTDPDEKVTLNIVDWSDSTKTQREALNQAFMKSHPNVTINYTTLTQAQFNETVLSGIRSGNAPDLFALPSSVTFQNAVSQGWFLPLNLYLDDDFFDQLDDSCWQENVTVQDGNTYLIPEAVDLVSTLLYYNQDVLDQAGITLDTSQPMSWSEFKEICRKVTESGDAAIADSGIQKARVDLEIRALTELSGGEIAQSGQIVVKDGKVTFDSDEVLEAMNFYRELVEQESFHPDSASMNAPEARALFAEGQAAFIFQGAWCIPVWKEQNPDLNFGVTYMPVPDDWDGSQISRPYMRGWMGISSQCEHPDIAAEYLEALYSYDYQKTLVEPGGFVSVRKDLGAEDMKDSTMQDYYTIALAESVERENPLSIHEENQYVLSMMESVSPDFSDIAAGILSGNVAYEQSLLNYSKTVQENLEKAIDVVSETIPVSLESFEATENTS